MFDVNLRFENEAQFLGFASALYLGRAQQAAAQQDTTAEVDAADPAPSPTVESPPMSETAGKPTKAVKAKRTRKGKSTKKPATEAAPAADAAPAGAEPAEEMTLETLRTIVRAYAQENGTDNVTKALAAFGVKRLPDLNAEQMAELAANLSG